MPQKFSLLFYILCCAVLTGAMLTFPKWQKPQTEATLSWDVSGYYFYLPAFLIYKDARQLEFREEIMQQYVPSSSFYQAFQDAEGHWVMKYPIGMAILYLPFFLLGHLIALVADYPADGFSLPYQAAVSWGSLLVAFIGLWVARKNLLLLFSDTFTGIVLFLLVFGTHYMEYASITGAMPHNYLFTIHAFLIAATIQWYKNPSYGWSVAIGVCIGLAALARPTEIIIALFPVLFGVEKWRDVSNRLQYFLQQLPKVVVMAAIVALIGGIQILYWKWATGHFFVYSYEDQSFSWESPHFTNVFFSYRKGWLIYTPMMLFALLGFIPLWMKYRSIFWAALLYTIVHSYITCAWDIWWYGGSLGQRAFIQAYPVLLFPLAAFVEVVWQKNWRKWVFLPLAGFCIWLNLFQTWQAHFGDFEANAMTKAYYWRIFGKTKVDDLDKKLLDTDEDYRGERRDVEAIYTNDMENLPDSSFVYTETGSTVQHYLYLDTPQEMSLKFDVASQQLDKDWLRVSADFFSPDKEFSAWHMPQLYISFSKNGQPVKVRSIRLHRFMNPLEWTHIWMDARIPTKPFDLVQVYFVNALTQKMLFVDNLTVEAYNEIP